MNWENIIKKLEPQNKMHGFAFRTPVEYTDTTSENLEKEQAIIEWEFSFGQRETYMREIEIYVTRVILPDETELTDEEIEEVNRNSPEIYGKLGPAELINYGKGEYDLTWSQ